MKILISGATGFIGKHLTSELIHAGHSVYAIIRPTTDTRPLDKRVKTYVYNGDISELVSFMSSEMFDGIIHLASLFLTQHQTKDIYPLVESNISFSTALLDAAVQSKIPWFINTGTFWQHYQNKKYSPVNLYAATKQAFENIAKYYYETSAITFVTIKLFATFGPLDTRPKIFNLWSKISKTGETLDMSLGEQIVDISFIKNVTDGYIQMIKLISKKNKKMSGKIFAISSPERMSLKKIAELFEKITKVKLNINWGGKPYSKREVMIPWNKYQSIPGWKQKVSLKEGLKKTFL